MTQENIENHADTRKQWEECDYTHRSKNDTLAECDKSPLRVKVASL